MDDSRFAKVRMALSGDGLRRRMDAAENAALGIDPKKKKPVPTSTPAAPAYRPPAAAVNARQAAIDAAQAADRAAIAEMNKKNSLRRR